MPQINCYTVYKYKKLNNDSAVKLSERLLELFRRSERFFKDDKYMRKSIGMHYKPDENLISDLVLQWRYFRDDCVLLRKTYLSVIWRLRVKAWIEQADEHIELLYSYLSNSAPVNLAEGV
ncbi:TPA: hypothetical protein G9F26_003961 [Salmonella enterica]|uniref:Uncharacterized protein n=1 Tax=Salmonella enterica TaxID=28901 RepID=A0A750HY47_SALER|nr:hypothetical protein [Salmonella enterica]